MKKHSRFRAISALAPTSGRALLLLAFTCFFLLGSGLFGQSLDTRALDSALDKLMGSSLVKGASIAVSFYSTGDSSLIYAHRANTGLMPASLQKLYTGIGAFDQLGADYRFQTLIGTRGEIVNGVLQGDLVVRGGGDPSWMENFYPQGPHKVFELWADSLRAQGIKKINGNLVGDISLYATQPLNKLWEKHNLPYDFSPATAALSFNANFVRFDLKGAAQAGNKAKASSHNGYNYFRINNQISTIADKGSAGIWMQVSADNQSVTLQGKLGVNTSQNLKAAVRNPPLFTLQVMRETLRKKGISISGKTILQTTPGQSDSLTTLLLFDSVALEKIMGVMLKTSSNMLAESLLCHIGASPDSGAVIIETLLQSKGIPGDKFHIADGSGLARQNRCSATHLGLTLCHASHQEWFDLFLNSLAFPGEQGTLRNRFTNLKGKARLFGKTGTLRDVSNLAGYLRAADGEALFLCDYLQRRAQHRQCQNLAGKHL